MPAGAQVEQTATPQAQQAKALKHKIAIGRFSNETRYGKTLLVDGDLDPLGKQASDILSAYMAQTGKFLVFERPDLSKIEREAGRAGEKNIIGVDALIVGSVVEFGQAVEGKRGFLNKSKQQKAHAKVAVRLVDVRTGLIFHSAVGQGEATTETRTVLGMGSTARFDGTLTDKALSVAIEDMLDELVNTLSGRQWRSDILAIEDGQVFISGGTRQGLKAGDRLAIMKAGKTVRSAQTGFDISLPPAKLAEIEVVSTFGDTETNEGSVARLVSGSLDNVDLQSVFVSGL